MQQEKRTHMQSTTSILLCGLLLIVSSCAGLQHNPNDTTGNSSIKTGKNDTNKYRRIVLDNQMEVVLISSDDPTAAAVLDIRVGSTSNPKDFPGLAHFLEHLLFLGTQKYPEPESYQKYIITNGGSYNATTGLVHTSYYFGIDSHKLEPALDRLARFFIDPLFGREYIDKELAIIESEYQRYRNIEGRAIYSAHKESYNPEHPASRFNTGNYEVLIAHGKEALYQALLRFYRQHYSANRMKLVVHGKKTLDQLEQMVRTSFSPVVNSKQPWIAFDQPVITPDSLPMLLQIQPKSDIYRLSYSFPIQEEQDAYFVKSASYIAHLLGHESEGSVLDYLRRQGWARGLSAGDSSTVDDHFMAISIELTPEGRQHIDEIHHAIFSYIALIREQGIEQWRYQELQKIGQLAFDYHEPSRTLELSKTLSRTIHYVPAQQAFEAIYKYSHWRPNQVATIVNAMTPDNVRITLTAPDVIVDSIPPRFDIGYSISIADTSSLIQPNTDAQLQLPKRNSFIPDALNSSPSLTNGTPHQIEDDTITLWNVPQQSRQKASINLGVLTERHRSNATTKLLKKIYLRALKQRLASDVYMAQLAGLHYQLYSHLSGITLRTTGYADKLPLFFESIATEISQWQLSADEFQQYRAELLRSINNQGNNSPSQRVGQRIAGYLIHEVSQREDELAIVESLHYNDWLAFVSSMAVEPKQLVMLGYGEISDSQLLKTSGKIKTLFPGPSLALDQLKLRRIDNQPTHIIEQTTRGQVTEVLELYLQFSGESYHQRIAANMLSNYLRSPFFHQLRTERKLGYQAGVFPLTLLEQPAIGFIVESDTVTSRALAEHFQQFIDRQQQAIASLDQESFIQLQQGVVTQLQQRNFNIGEESRRYWNELNNGNTSFDTNEQLIHAATIFTLKDLQHAYQHNIVNNQRRLWALTQLKEHSYDHTVFGDRVN